MSEKETKNDEKKVEKKVVVEFTRPCHIKGTAYRKDEVAGFVPKIAKDIVEQKFGKIIKK